MPSHPGLPNFPRHRSVLRLWAIEEAQKRGRTGCWFLNLLRPESCSKTSWSTLSISPSWHGFHLSLSSVAALLAQRLRDPRGGSLYNPSSSRCGGRVEFQSKLLLKSESVILPQFWIWLLLLLYPTHPALWSQQTFYHLWPLQVWLLCTAWWVVHCTILEVPFPQTEKCKTILRVMHNCTRHPWARSFYDFLSICYFLCQECPLFAFPPAISSPSESSNT